MKRLLTALPSAFLIMASPVVPAQGLPTPEQFRQWDARFTPGLYEFVDFELTPDGQPKGEGSPPRQICMDRMKTYLLARGTHFADAMAQCDLIGVKLDARGLTMAHNCSGPAEKKRPVIGTIVISQAEPDIFLAIVARQVHDPKASPEEPISGTVHAFKRVGRCD